MLNNNSKDSNEKECVQQNKSIMIFTLRKTEAKNLEFSLKDEGFKTVCLHGDKTQPERLLAFNSFKNGYCNILVATDVASRGLDIPDVRAVIN